MNEAEPITLHQRRGGPLEWMRWIPAALLAIAFLVFAVISGRIILVPILVSVAVAYLLAPVVGWFERRGWSRSSSAILSITAISLVVVLVLINGFFVAAEFALVKIRETQLAPLMAKGASRSARMPACFSRLRL